MPNSLESTSKGWMPGVTKIAVPSTNFAAGNYGRRAVVMHMMDGWMAGTRAYFQDPARELSAHFGISQVGDIDQYVSVLDTAYANGLSWNAAQRCWVDPQKNLLKAKPPTWKLIQPPTNPNLQTISIELEGMHAQPRPDVQIAAAVRVLRWIAAQFPILLPSYRVGESLIGHCDLSTIVKANCPGPFVNLGTLAALANVQSTSAAPALITPDSSLIAPPRATEAQCVAYLTRRPTGAYTRFDVASIVRSYFALCTGLDPLLALAQLVHETGSLTSTWSQPPHRNPAGIGVTGAPGAGLSFPDWESAAKAHIGRLFAYAVKASQGTAAQQQLITSALNLRALPAAYRGAAPTLRGLENRWAVPGKNYAQAIADIANAIVRG